MTNHGCMAMTLKSKPYQPNGNVQKSQDWKKHVRFTQMWRFCSLFSSIAMAWCIMDSCDKVVRLIRNATLKLCADCAKHFVRNAHNCGKTNHGFCTIYEDQLYMYEKTYKSNIFRMVWVRCQCCTHTHCNLYL